MIHIDPQWMIYIYMISYIQLDDVFFRPQLDVKNIHNDINVDDFGRSKPVNLGSNYPHDINES